MFLYSIHELLSIKTPKLDPTPTPPLKTLFTPLSPYVFTLAIESLHKSTTEICIKLINIGA